MAWPYYNIIKDNGMTIRILLFKNAKNKKVHLNKFLMYINVKT